MPIVEKVNNFFTRKEGSISASKKNKTEQSETNKANNVDDTRDGNKKVNAQSQKKTIWKRLKVKWSGVPSYVKNGLLVCAIAAPIVITVVLVFFVSQVFFIAVPFVFGICSGIGVGCLVDVPLPKTGTEKQCVCCPCCLELLRLKQIDGVKGPSLCICNDSSKNPQHEEKP